MCEKPAADSAGEEWVRNLVKALTRMIQKTGLFLIVCSVSFCFESSRSDSTATSSNIKNNFNPL